MFTTKIIRFFGVSKFNPSKDYYKILNVQPTASTSEIKKSFHMLAKKYHPDANDGRQQKFKEVNEAYQILSSEEVKQEYDQTRNYSSRSSSENSYTRSSKQENPFRNTYRGYQRQTGWNDSNYRQRVMQQIFRNQQKGPQYRNERMKDRESDFEQRSYHHAENIRKYNPQIKIKQEQIRRAFQQEKKRREKQFQQYKDEEKIDMGEVMEKKLRQMGQGLKDNVEGAKRVGEYVKSIWDSFKKKK